MFCLFLSFFCWKERTTRLSSLGSDVTAAVVAGVGQKQLMIPINDLLYLTACSDNGAMEDKNKRNVLPNITKKSLQKPFELVEFESMWDTE